MKHSWSNRFALLVLSAAMTLTAASVMAEDFYAGKTITVLYGYSPGGTANLQSEVLSRNLAKHVPGNPKIIVKSMPGTGGIKAQNFAYERAKKDGLTILYTPTAQQAQMIEKKGIRFDYNKFTLIGAMLGNNMISYARRDVVAGGLKRPEDILKAENLKQAGLRADAWYDLYTRQALELLGMKNVYVPGYRGSAKIAAALRSGEANIAGGPAHGFFKAVMPSMGDVVMGLWYFPFVDENGNFIKGTNVADLPSFIDFYKKLRGKEPSGRPWVAMKYFLELRAAVTNAYLGPPGMNKQAAADLRTGFDKMINDPQSIADQMKVLGSRMIPVKRAYTQKVFASLSKVDPEMKNLIYDYAAKAPGK